MDVPKIGRTQGIFEIFVPGLFLLLNIVGACYLCPWFPFQTRSLLLEIGKNVALSVVVVISFGYFVGVLLRLMKTNFVDKASSWWAWNMFGKWKGHPKEQYFEGIPYFSYLEWECSTMLPPEATKFLKEVWLKRTSKSAGSIFYKDNREFFNYCKTIINDNDSPNVDAVFAAEALTRYVASIFNALCISMIILLVVLFSRFGHIPCFMISSIIVFYLLGAIIILRNFKFLRMKEVDLVFTATLKYYCNNLAKRISTVPSTLSENFILS
jgi:hypothetical protein